MKKSAKLSSSIEVDSGTGGCSASAICRQPPPPITHPQLIHSSILIRQSQPTPPLRSDRQVTTIRLLLRRDEVSRRTSG